MSHDFILTVNFFFVPHFYTSFFILHIMFVLRALSLLLKWIELDWISRNFSNQEPFVQPVFFWTLIRPAVSAYELTYDVIEIWLIKPSSMSICLSVRTSVLTSSVRPSTKSFSDFEWNLVCRYRSMSDARRMPYGPIQGQGQLVKVTWRWRLDILPFSKSIFAIFHRSWQMTADP